VLREISAQTADSTSATSQAIIKLADLSAALRKSVSGFRLPGLAAATGMHRTIPPPPAAPGASGTHRRVKALGGS
jgi:hypothetical protein